MPSGKQILVIATAISSLAGALGLKLLTPEQREAILQLIVAFCN